MQKLRTKILSLEDKADFPAILGLLSKKFEVGEAAASVEDRTYYDTFDWRLYRDNLVFFSSAGRLSLQRFNGRNIAEGPGRKRARYLLSDIGSKKFADQLGKRIEMRALVPIVEVATRLTEFRIMNRDRKTVARMSLRDDQPVQSVAALPELVTVTEIRGYEQEFETITDCFEERGCETIKKKHLVHRLLNQGERVPGGQGAKFNVALAPDVTIGQAVARICLHLVGEMKTNEPGIINDVDSEFLHDFRIAVRRTRSLLSLMKKVLPAESCAYFQKEFSWLGSVTGPLRDIDVYLLEKEAYLSLLPESLRSGMHCFFDQIQTRRVDELKILRKHLGAPRYQNLIDDWCAFLEQPDSELHDGAGAGRCRTFADKMILKRFNSFLRHGDAIHDSTPDEKLHKLRIRGKKFRYLLEFFKSFYDQKEMSAFLKHMKKLQDNLGTFNDLSVQQHMLSAELDSLRGRNLQSLRFAASLGGLIGVLSEKQKTVRAQFESTYSAFAQPRVRSILYTLVDH